MITNKGLLIKINRDNNRFFVTRQSIGRGVGEAIEGKRSFFINSVRVLEFSHASNNCCYLDGEANVRGNESFDKAIKNGMMHKFFTTIIFPKAIMANSGFNYQRDVTL